MKLILILLLLLVSIEAGAPCSNDSQCSKMRKCIQGKCTLKPSHISKLCLKKCPPGTRCVNGKCLH